MAMLSSLRDKRKAALSSGARGSSPEFIVTDVVAVFVRVCGRV